MLLTVATVAGVLRVVNNPAPTAAVAGVAPFRVTVDLDGTTSVVTTTAHRATVETSADKLGRQLGVGKLVAVRTAPTHLTEGSSVVFRTRKSGQLSVDGQTVPYDSPSLTVAELLAEVAQGGARRRRHQHVRRPTPCCTDGTPVEVVLIVGAETSPDHRASRSASTPCSRTTRRCRSVRPR